MLTMEDDVLISSTLPLDLERHIFRLLAVARPVEIPRLMRVAWRVKHWVEPLLYRTLIINRKPIDDLPSCDFDTLRRIIRTKSATFLHESVRNLMLHKPTVKDVEDILPLLSGVENLRITSWNTVFADNSSTPPGFDVLPLRHLYRGAWGIFDFHTIRRLYHLCFAEITHLALFDDTLNPVEFTLCADFADLPHLTHLAFHINVAPMFSVCLQLLEMCKRLRVLVILGSSGPWKSTKAALSDDPRFVMMEFGSWSDDWQRGVLTGADYWRRAEDFVAKRISGKVDRHTFILDE